MGTALVRYGNIFQRSVDLTVLPQSAKGTFSDWVRSHQDNYGIPKPSPLELGRVSDPILFTGSGNITKYVVYAASVRDDKSTPEVISEIGFRLGQANIRYRRHQVTGNPHSRCWRWAST